MATRVATIALLLAAAGASAQQAPLFEYGGTPYAVDDLSPRMQQLYGTVVADQHRAMRTLVDEMVFDVYVEQEAARQGREAQEVGRELLAVPAPDEAAVRAFYEQNRARIAQPLEDVSDSIRQHLQQQALLERRSAILARVKQEGRFKLLLELRPAPPIAINTRGRPVRGNPSAPITLVEFADYQCPNCKRAVSILQSLLDRYPDDIKLVHMDFPINSSGISRQIAYGGICAHAQGRFWDYHDLAYTRQQTLAPDSSSALAETLGLDMSAFAACMSDQSTRAKVTASHDEARRLGVTATPTLFVDGRPFPSNHLLRDLSEYIEKKKAAGS
jgi:protein-disulfide isomerase